LFLQLPLLARAWAAAEGAGWATAAPRFFGDPGLAALAQGSCAAVVRVNAGPGMAGKWSLYLETGRGLVIAVLFRVGIVLQRLRPFADAAARRRTWLAVAMLGAIAWGFVVLAEPRLLPAPPEAGGAPMQRQAVEWLTGEWRALSAMAFQ